MDVRVGDIVTMKKPHPCGSRTWLVMRVGADFRLHCTVCGREIMITRRNAEKGIRSLERKQDSD